ncbi:hypothetical protein PTMSG1_01869 [Pyrenophora teres f. maculata]|nr:hypothetical protein PTMSG1_01869 [Pyrenophora teres f. maculata]
MPPPPPPPPPMPPMGRGAGGPPPPPMLGKAPGGKAAGGAGRGALLGDISKGMKLKKVAQVNDRSAPITGKVSDGPSAAPMGAPAIPGMGKPPAVPGLAPPVPGGGNRGRSNSDTGDGGGAAPPQLAGIFAGGMPKLRKAGGREAKATAADWKEAAYATAIFSKAIWSCPPSSNSFTSSCTACSRWSSTTTTTTTSCFDLSSTHRGTTTSPSATAISGSASPSTIDPTPTPSDDEYDPYKYSAPAPPPPPPNGHVPSLAETAARNAFGRASPAAPPPPPPAAPPSAPAPPPPTSTAPSRQASQTPLRSMMDPSSYTLSNGGSSIKSPTHSGGGSREKGRVRPIQDLRWRFQDEGQFPRPREFTNGPKKYRAGRGSSVPLDLSAYE